MQLILYVGIGNLASIIIIIKPRAFKRTKINYGIEKQSRLII